MSIWTTFKNALGANRVPILYGLSSADGKTPVPIAADQNTGELLVGTGGGALPAVVINGQQTVTTSDVALPSGAITQGVVLESLSTNTVSIFIGGAGVTTGTGYELTPGSAIGIALANTSGIHVRCASGSPVVTWIGS